jgi:DNA invertase Pin-like site-specific DNA recombinase
MAIVEIIKPTKLTTNTVSADTPKRRVCAYARVSTDDLDQLNSYKVQIDEFTRKIHSNPNWTFVGMFADEGISGTQAKKRPEFMKMIESARNGEIDLILTKSISRFGRNTAEIINFVRELRQINVEIFFEKENLSSLDTKTDFILSILSSVAQEESRSISTNVKWAVEKRYKQGISPLPRVFGYVVKDKKYIIHEQEAKVIREVYSMLFKGYGINDIAKYMNSLGVTTVKGNKWNYSNAKALFFQEKYCGEVLLQKQISTDYLSHKMVKNDGIAPQYLVKNHHEQIVSKEDFEKAKTILESNAQRGNPAMFTKYPLSSLVYCPTCKRVMKRNTVGYGRPSEKVILNCNHSYKNNYKCESNHPAYDLVIGSIKSTFGFLANNIKHVPNSKRNLFHKEFEQINIKELVSIVIADAINVIIVISTKSTNELITQIDNIKMMEPIHSDICFDKKLNSGIIYKVVIVNE